MAYEKEIESKPLCPPKGIRRRLALFAFSMAAPPVWNREPEVQSEADPQPRNFLARYPDDTAFGTWENASQWRTNRRPMRIAIAYFVGLIFSPMLLLIYHALAHDFAPTTTLSILAMTTIVVGIFLLAATIYSAREAEVIRSIDEGRE